LPQLSTLIDVTRAAHRDPFAPVVVYAGFGILFLIAALLIYAGVQVWIQTHWPTAIGTATSCSAEYRTSSRTGFTTLAGQSCLVRWQFDGTTHSDVVSLGPFTKDGDFATLYVNGDSAVTHESQPGGYVLGAIGIAILGFMAWLRIRAWRPIQLLRAHLDHGHGHSTAATGEHHPHPNPTNHGGPAHPAAAGVHHPHPRPALRDEPPDPSSV
jgi:hypothetical protein